MNFMDFSVFGVFRGSENEQFWSFGHCNKKEPSELTTGA